MDGDGSTTTRRTARRGATDLSGTLHLRPIGALDPETCDDLRAQLGAAFSVGVGAVEIDLQDVTSVDATGLGVLSGAARHLASRGGRLSVVRPTPAVLKVLRINELLDLVDVPVSAPLTVPRPA